MLKLSVNASKNYDISVTSGIESFKPLCKLIKGKKVAVITDDTVYGIYGDILKDYIEDKDTYFYVFPHGEENKNAENYLKILNFLAENQFTRKDGIITLGGGVVGDLGAFAASTYMRGISLIAVPTTLLSAVDSSVGGKTAIDLKSGKNLCGTFYQPDAVYINVDFLKTLPTREITSGMGEVVKYAFLNETITADLISRGITEELIYKCLKIKADVVEKDEKESGLRMILNLGHTVGHAIEQLSGYKYSHGECVAKGIKFAIDISNKIYNFSQEKLQKCYNLLSAYKFDLTCEFSSEQLVEQIKADKKSDGEKINFVTIQEIGNTPIKAISFEKLFKLL